MKRKFMVLLCTALTLCLITGCGKDKDSTDNNSDNNVPTATEAPTPSSDLEENGEEGGETEETPTPEPEPEEESPAPEETPEEKEPASVKTGKATGTLNGFADSHTVEITLDNGKIFTYQIDDDDVLAALEEYDMQTEPTSFSFTYTKEKNNRIITSID